MRFRGARVGSLGLERADAECAFSQLGSFTRQSSGRANSLEDWSHLFSAPHNKALGVQQAWCGPQVPVGGFRCPTEKENDVDLSHSLRDARVGHRTDRGFLSRRRCSFLRRQLPSFPSL